MLTSEAWGISTRGFESPNQDVTTLSEAWGISTRGFESPNQDVTTLSEAWGIRTPDNLIKSQVLYRLS